MKDILAVCLRQTYKKGIGPGDLKNITTSAWRIDKRKIQDIKYIVGIKDKEIKSIYKVKSVKEIKDDFNRTRYCFDVYDELDNSIERMIKNNFNNKIKFNGNPVRYFAIEDLK